MIITCKNPSCAQEIRTSTPGKKNACPACGRFHLHIVRVTEPSGDFCAYLDIETTGLSPVYSELTVVGICIEREHDNTRKIIQLTGNRISAESVENALNGARKLYTYNGSRFDLKFIKAKLGIDAGRICAHEDLMFSCWKRNLYGGLKSVERQLGITRKTAGLRGEDAVRLWYDYMAGDGQALRLLLEYNKEDIINLILLKDKLKS